MQLVLGLAAIFQGLLQQQSGASLDFALLAQGRTWLQQALTAHETMPDAHLGLGLLYFIDLGRPVLVPRLDGAGRDHTAETLYHLRQAAESGHFSGEVARTFLVRVYELEKRYEEAITLGQALQATFPGNGYYALVSGRSQCAQGQYALCATTLGQLAADLQAAVIAPLSRDDRFDLYYFGVRPCTRRGKMRWRSRPSGRPSTRIQAIPRTPVCGPNTIWVSFMSVVVQSKPPGSSITPSCAGAMLMTSINKSSNASPSSVRLTGGVATEKEHGNDGVMDSTRMAHLGERIPGPG